MELNGLIRARVGCGADYMTMNMKRRVTNKVLIKANEPRQPKTRATKRKAAFLRAFEDSGSVTHSALLAGIDPATHCDWLATDARYKAAFEAAIPLAAGAGRWSYPPGARRCF